MRAQIKTPRLVLRWLEQRDAKAVQAGCSNWNVARMLAKVPHPYPDGMAEDWISGHADERARGQGSAFAITLAGAVIGVVGIDRGTRDECELGYWLDEPYWGNGYATEAAQAAVTVGFADLGVGHINSGHFEDNAASGRVLLKCGFAYSGTSKRPCLARGTDVPSCDLIMHRYQWVDRLKAQQA